MAAAASDVPSLFDVVINGEGYILLDALESSYPFRVHRATYQYSPTFIERQNVSGNFGDNQQDFWLSATQNDWSLGEQQRYFRQSDGDSARRYWQGSPLDITVPGQASVRLDVSAKTAAANVLVAGQGRTPATVAYATSTNLYEISAAGTISDRGAHGLGASPTAIATDGSNIYLSTTAAGTVGIRRWDGAAYTTFSASGADELAFLNNTLYGFRNAAATGDLVKYDTAGTVSSIYTWKTANGTIANVTTKLRPFGGKLLILRYMNGQDQAASLWLYDATAPSKLGDLPSNFLAWDLCVVRGVAFIGGAFDHNQSGQRPAVFFYSNGSLDLLWKASADVTAGSVSVPQAAVGRYDNGLIFSDTSQNKLIYYDPAAGGTHAFAPYSQSTATGAAIGSAQAFFCIFQLGTTSFTLFPGAAQAASATLTTSLFDFDSSLTKALRGVTVDFDGAGGAVDIAYRLNDLASGGAFTSLQTGANSGLEALFPAGTTARSVAVQLTLQSNAVIIKRIRVRAAPVLQRFRNREYVVNCTGSGGASNVRRRDGSSHQKTGREMADDLVTAAASTVPITIVDRFGSYTGIIESLELYEEHPGLAGDLSKSGEFVAKVTCREV